MNKAELERHLIGYLDEHDAFFGTAGWLEFQVLVHYCFLAGFRDDAALRIRQETRIRKILDKLLRRGVVRQEIPVNEPENDLWQKASPLDLLAEV
jgi:hypothetical protein